MSQVDKFTVPILGTARVPSPIPFSTTHGDTTANYVSDQEAILFDITARWDQERGRRDSRGMLELAGPREHLYFEPQRVHAAIVTCGGLCPGLNDVIRALVRCLWYRYGVRRISGIQFGYWGLLPDKNLPVVPLNPTVVDDIHQMGGSMLGSSRGGGERTGDIVDTLERLELNMLFTIGGDGTQKGAQAIAEEAERRGLDVAVVGVPKTIDNDLSLIQKSFGFETAVSVASDAVASAHAEAHSAINGIGLVKLMGRESGFIAAYAALASNEANFVLIPEVPFELEGENGLLRHLRDRLERRNHAVIIVGEGAGQELVATQGTDAGGNRVLGDIGAYLRDRIKEHFSKAGMPFSLKYIDPSYMIRSAVAVADDSVYCSRLGNNAAHAAMAGKTRMLVSLVNNYFVHIPIAPAVGARNKVHPESTLWRDVLEATQQPISMVNR